MNKFLDQIEEKEIPAMGGTELMFHGLKKHTSFESNENLNMILSTPKVSSIRYTKKNILWQHLNYSDESLGPIRDRSFIGSIDAQVYVSNWQYEKFRYLFQVPTHNAYIIKNAIEPINFKKREKSEKIKLIYASTPWRGLDVLLRAFELLERDDVELHVYSSTKLYGSGFANFIGPQYDWLFEKASSMKNVTYHGLATNSEIRKAMQSCHILAYPSIFEETSCLVMIEAGAAGCEMVTTNLGALYETGAEYAKMIPVQSDRDVLIRNYAKALEESIDNYWNKDNQKKLKEQSDYYNKYYSWDLRSKEWNILFEKISEKDSLVQKGHPSFG